MYLTRFEAAFAAKTIRSVGLFQCYEKKPNRTVEPAYTVTVFLPIPYAFFLDTVPYPNQTSDIFEVIFIVIGYT